MKSDLDMSLRREGRWRYSNKDSDESGTGTTLSDDTGARLASACRLSHIANSAGDNAWTCEDGRNYAMEMSAAGHRGRS